MLDKRGIWTDQIDLAATFDLLLVGRGGLDNRRGEALLDLQSWAAMRHRPIGALIAGKYPLLEQMDRAFPDAGHCLSGSQLDVKVGRLVIAELSGPARLAQLGPERFRRFAANRDALVALKVAERFMAAARTALPLQGTATARELVAADLHLLQHLEAHAADVEERMARLLPATQFGILTTIPRLGGLPGGLLRRCSRRT